MERRVGDQQHCWPECLPGYEAAAFARAVCPRWIVPLHLHCTGKWLDRAAGLRIEVDNIGEVEVAAQGWAASLAEEGLGAKMLAPGGTWQP